MGIIQRLWSALKPYKTWIVLVGTLVVGWLMIHMISQAIYRHDNSHLSDQSNQLLQLTQARVNKSSDPTHLANVGQQLLAQHYPQFAALYFKRASDLNPNLRDVDYAWGYAIVKKDNGRLSAADTKQVLLAISRTEYVDPLYVPMLQFKLVVAQSTHDQTTFNATQARLALLPKATSN
jgi:hypothetical protein